MLSGRRDLYKLFLVRGRELIQPNGWFSILTPLGMYVEDDSSQFRQSLFNDGSVTELRHYQNYKKVFFPHVHARYRFCQITFSRSKKLHHRFTCVARSPEEITRIPAFVVERDEFDSQLGKTRSAIIYPDRRYGEIHQRVDRHLAPHSAPPFNVVAEFHSSTDKKSIAAERADESDWVVLKNRNIHQFDYLFAAPEAFVSRATVIEHLDRKGLSDRWIDKLPRLVFRDIARNDDERTLIACLAPPGFASSYDTPMAFPQIMRMIWQSSLRFTVVLSIRLFSTL